VLLADDETSTGECRGSIQMNRSPWKTLCPNKPVYHDYLKSYLCLQLGIPPPRYQAVYVDIDQTSYDHAQSICENFGSGLATVIDYLDIATLNITLKGINAQEYCSERMFLGAKSPGNFVWSWRTGESISNAWELWAPNEPSRDGEACLRMGIDSASWMIMFDHYCSNDGPWITQFKCCICDTLP